MVNCSVVIDSVILRSYCYLAVYVCGNVVGSAKKQTRALCVLGMVLSPSYTPASLHFIMLPIIK